MKPTIKPDLKHIEKEEKQKYKNNAKKKGIKQSVTK